MANHPNRTKEARLRRAYAVQTLREAVALALRCGDAWGELNEHDRQVYLSEAKSSLPACSEMIALGWIKADGISEREFEAAMTAAKSKAATLT